jgi:hypothetical protein
MFHRLIGKIVIRVEETTPRFVKLSDSGPQGVCLHLDDGSTLTVDAKDCAGQAFLSAIASPEYPRTA